MAAAETVAAAGSMAAAPMALAKSGNRNDQEYGKCSKNLVHEFLAESA